MTTYLNDGGLVAKAGHDSGQTHVVGAVNEVLNAVKHTLKLRECTHLRIMTND